MMMTNKQRFPALILSLLFALSFPVALQAAGTYAEGWMLIKKLTKFESGGLIIESWEGEALVHSFDPQEKCDEKQYQCFTPKDRVLKFSVRPENGKTVNFLRRHKDLGGYLVHYQIHRFEALALSTEFEVIDVASRTSDRPANIPAKKIVEKTGSRNFSFHGNVLQLDYRGTALGTYEGLYLDQRTGKVHPFSITNEQMAQYIFKAMKISTPYYMGVSVALVIAFPRESDHDIFELNFLEEAGGVQEKKPAKGGETGDSSPKEITE